MADGRPSAFATMVAAIPVALGLLATVTSGTAGDAAARTRGRGAAGTAETAAAERPQFDAGPVVAADTATARGHLNVYFGNLHAHTSLSDGVQDPDDAYAFARDEAGLDFILLSEHNHAQAGRIANNHSLYSGSQASSLISVANRMTENGTFVALYGQEFSTIGSGNHMNVLDVPNVIGVTSGAFDKLLNEFLPNNPDTTGGLAVLLLNHPATHDNPDNEYGRDDFGSEAEWIRRMRDHASLIAMINGPSDNPGIGVPPGRPAESEVFRYLNLGFLLAPTADQDNHRPNWGLTTHARTAVIADELSKPALLKAMKARHVYATEDRNLRVVCRVNSQMCGDRLAAPAVGTELQIEFTIHDDDEPSASYEIDVFADEIGGDPARNPTEVVAQEGNTGGVPLKIQDVRYNGGSQYVFFRIRQQTEDDEDRVWTAPVWLEPGGPPPLPPPVDESQFVASRNSRIFHPEPACQGARDIKPQNRLTGAEARRNRTAHQGCPLKAGGGT